MLEILNKTPRILYGGTQRNFQVKQILKLHFLMSTLQTLNSGLSRFEVGLGLALFLNHWKSRVFKKFAYNASDFFKKAILQQSKN